MSVFRGAADGLAQGRGKTLDRDSAKVAGTASFTAVFGSTITREDLDADGDVDLVVGAGGQKGSLNVFYGGPNGITGARDEQLTQPKYVPDNEPFGGFGGALAAADFDGDGYPDLAVGIPYEDAEQRVQVVPNVGAVLVISGTADGLGDELAYIEHIDSFENPTTTSDQYGLLARRRRLAPPRPRGSHHRSRTTILVTSTRGRST